MALDLKRAREGDAENVNNMANCLILLSRGGDFEAGIDRATSAGGGGATSRVFECKTCNRQFTSFQALGGHRASHKKSRLMGDLSLQPGGGHLQTSPAKPKTHECPVCGLEFAIGQALGGHMRRHRTAAMNENQTPSLSLSPPHQHQPSLSLSPPHPSPIVKRSNIRRVLCLDLNLTPSENKFLLGKMTPAVDCFF